MPTYEYRCKSCGQHIEAVQSFTDDPLTVCGACGGELRKVFGSIGVSFKGSGFYRTDSRASSSSKKSASKETASTSSESGSSSSSGDSGSSKSSGEGTSSSKSDSSSSKSSDSGSAAKSA